MIQFLETTGATVTEPYPMEHSGSLVTVSMKVKNISTTTTLENLGFYLKTVTSMDFQSLKDPGEQLAFILSKGDSGYGITIDSGEGAVRFTSTVGSSYDNRITLSDDGTLEPGDECEITITYDLDSAITAEAIGIDLVLE